MDFVALWLELKEIFIDVVKYGFPTLAITLSILSFRDSRKARKVQERLNRIEEKLKQYELEEKEKERAEASMACVEARIMNISRGKYVMKIWNSGKVTAYNIDFKIPEEYSGIVWKDKTPYEFLEPGKSFEEIVLVHSGTPSKFKVTTIWTDIENNPFTKEQFVSI